MRTLALAVLMALATPAPAFAQAEAEVVFVGELRSITLTPRDWQAERRAREAGGPLIISNGCGTASTTFRVLHATARLPREVETTSDLGEWCEPPVTVSQHRWLVVMTGQRRELQASYAIIEQQGAAYALFLDPGALLDQRSAGVRALLNLQPLPEPIEYDVTGVASGDRLAEWVSRRPALELRDGQVWIARAIPLTQVFPGYANE
jgi:hypothetical protein